MFASRFQRNVPRRISLTELTSDDEVNEQVD